MNPFFVAIFILSVMRTCQSVKPIDVYWNISNPIFGGGYGADYENVIEVNRDTHPWEYDQVGTRVIFKIVLFNKVGVVTEKMFLLKYFLDQYDLVSTQLIKINRIRHLQVFD